MEQEIKGMDLSSLAQKNGEKSPNLLTAFKTMQQENETNKAESKAFEEYLIDSYGLDDMTDALTLFELIQSTYGYEKDNKDYVFGLEVDEDFCGTLVGEEGYVFANTYYNYAITHGQTPEEFITEYFELRQLAERRAVETFLGSSHSHIPEENNKQL